MTHQIAICAPSHNFVGLYLRNEGMYRQSEKSLLNGNISSICLHNILNFGQLMAEIWWQVWGTPAIVNGFRVLASLLHRRRSTDVNQTLHDVRPSPALVYYIYTFGGSCPLLEFCQLQNSHCVQILRSHILTALLHDTRALGVSQTLWRSAQDRTGHHLYSAWRPSCWASAHILVVFNKCRVT